MSIEMVSWKVRTSFATPEMVGGERRVNEVSQDLGTSCVGKGGSRSWQNVCYSTQEPYKSAAGLALDISQAKR